LRAPSDATIYQLLIYSSEPIVVPGTLLETGVAKPTTPGDDADSVGVRGVRPAQIE